MHIVRPSASVATTRYRSCMRLQKNMFEQASSDYHQMSLVDGSSSGVMSTIEWLPCFQWEQYL